MLVKQIHEDGYAILQRLDVTAGFRLVFSIWLYFLSWADNLFFVAQSVKPLRLIMQVFFRLLSFYGLLVFWFWGLE